MTSDLYVIMLLLYYDLFYITMPYGRMINQWSVCVCECVNTCVFVFYLSLFAVLVLYYFSFLFCMCPYRILITRCCNMMWTLFHIALCRCLFLLLTVCFVLSQGLSTSVCVFRNCAHFWQCVWCLWITNGGCITHVYVHSVSVGCIILTLQQSIYFATG
jgi:hypothetical protein